MIVSLGSILITAAYLILIELFYKGWLKLSDFKASEVLPDRLSVSVIVSCKNEAQNLPALINSLQSQSHTSFELVLVDDHSTDNSFELMLSLTADMSNVKVLKSMGSGKKAALIYAVNAASGDIVLTTDADCILPVHWIQTVVSYHLRFKPDLLLAPVVLRSNGSFFQNLQKLEFTSLVASGAGAVGANIPILANAANMSFTRNAFLLSVADLREDIPSGDDIFLLNSVKKREGKIDFLKSEAALVETIACKDLKSFIRQRQRWASKFSALRDYHQLFIIFIILGISFMEILAFFAGIIRPYFWLYLVLMFVAKLSADYIFLSKVNHFFKNKSLLLHSLVVSLIYPVYVLYSTFSSFKPAYFKRR